MNCDRLNCEEIAYWNPVICVSPDGVHYARGPMNLNVCDKHKEEMTVDDVVDDRGWMNIVGGILVADLAEPVRELTKLEWQPINTAP